MKLRSNKAFSLLEVLITVAILSGAIVFVFRSFTASLSSVKFSQNITIGCLLAENKLWEIEQKQSESLLPLNPESDTQKLVERDFKYSYETANLEDISLIKLKLTVSWKENIREKDYSMEFLTYLLPKK